MSQEHLQETAEALKGEEVTITLTNDEQLQGQLTAVRINTVTFDVAIELSDPQGKGILIPLKQIDAIKAAV